MTVAKIEHKQKHDSLKHLAEAGTSILISQLPDKTRVSLYKRILSLLVYIESLEESDECTCKVERETKKTVSLETALKCLADGHILWTPKDVYQICKAVGVPYPRHLERHWYSDWTDPKGMHMAEGCEGSIGIDGLTLSSYVADKLGVWGQAGHYIGRGFQAQAYARVIREALKGKES